MLHELFHQVHMHVVVAVSLIGLEHGELGVMASRGALVAEHPSNLKHLFESANNKPLEVELRSNSQKHLLV